MLMDSRQPSRPITGTEVLVGVADSQWPLTNPHALLPGDIILRVGDSDSSRSAYAPFEDGINGVRRAVLSWALRDEQKQNRVPLQVHRGNSRLNIWPRVTPAAAAEAEAAEASAAGTAREGDSYDGSYDCAATASFETDSYRLAGTFGTDCSYDAGENLLEGVVLSEGRHALFAPLAAWTEESILRLERIKAYGALTNHKPRPVEKEEQRNRRGDLYSRLPPASVRAHRAAGIGCCFAGGAVEGEGEEEEREDLGAWTRLQAVNVRAECGGAEEAEEWRNQAEGSLPAREAVGKLAEGIARLRMGWARARDAGGEAGGDRAPLLAHAPHPAEGYREGVIGVQIGGRRGDERLSRVGVCTTRDAEEPSSNPSFGGIEPAVDNELSNFADSASARMFCGTRGATIATSALGGCRRAVPGAPQVVLPHLYSRLAASGEYFTGEGWDRLDGGEECIEEEEGERGAVGGDEYWGERAEGVVAGCGGPGAAGAAAVAAAAAAAAAGAAAGGTCDSGPMPEDACDLGSRTRPSSPTHRTSSPAASTVAAAAGTAAAAAAAAAGTAAKAEGVERQGRLWAGRAAAAPAAATSSPVLKVRRHCIAEVAEKDDSGGSSKGLGGTGPASLFTILVMPAESGGKKESRRFFDVNHTIDRALRWFSSVRASGAALELMNAQTEVLPVRLGGMDGDKLAKMAQYGKWTVKTNDEQRGDHISVLRAVRLWLVPESEVELTLVLASGGVNNAACPPDWGLLLEQTPEGVVHVVGVRGGSPADKGGVAMLLRMARAKKRLLLLSRLQGQVLLPAVIANGQIDCADVEALQEQLVLQAHLPSIPLRLTFAL
ncbi:hypothetical protein CLOM_g24191 [Closterium sp. NIES-68]|nr:hypothetical protein CLOM_g24191 [Closterium sp. NIES-68]